jgi:WhiB family redox-sensing transcriptional regulator
MSSKVPGFMRFAPCAQVDPDAMFPTPGDVQGLSDAKRVCASCEFTNQCLAWALAPETRANEGVFGGKSENERKRMKRAPAKRYYVGPLPPKNKRHAPAA